MLFWISLHRCHVVDFRRCMWAKTSNYRTGAALHLKGISSYIWAHTHSLSHTNAHILFPRLRLGALIFPKVSSCGPCARLSGELWKGWRRLACWMKKPRNMCFLWHSSLPLLSALLHHLPPPLRLLSRRITDRNWTFDSALLSTAAISV